MPTWLALDQTLCRTARWSLGSQELPRFHLQVAPIWNKNHETVYHGVMHSIRTRCIDNRECLCVDEVEQGDPELQATDLRE
jgi:hypothetical protein